MILRITDFPRAVCADLTGSFSRGDGSCNFAPCVHENATVTSAFKPDLTKLSGNPFVIDCGTVLIS